MVSPETYALVSDLVSEALELEPEERSRFLDRSCGGDPAVRREVDSLLSHENALEEGFLEVPAIAEVRRTCKETPPSAPPVKAGGTGAVSVRELLAKLPDQQD